MRGRVYKTLGTLMSPHSLVFSYSLLVLIGWCKIGNFLWQEGYSNHNGLKCCEIFHVTKPPLPLINLKYPNNIFIIYLGSNAKWSGRISAPTWVHHDTPASKNISQPSSCTPSCPGPPAWLPPADVPRAVNARHALKTNASLTDQR